MSVHHRTTALDMAGAHTSYSESAIKVKYQESLAIEEAARREHQYTLERLATAHRNALQQINFIQTGQWLDHQSLVPTEDAYQQAVIMLRQDGPVNVPESHPVLERLLTTREVSTLTDVSLTDLDVDAWSIDFSQAGKTSKQVVKECIVTHDSDQNADKEECDEGKTTHKAKEQSTNQVVKECIVTHDSDQSADEEECVECKTTHKAKEKTSKQVVKECIVTHDSDQSADEEECVEGKTTHKAKENTSNQVVISDQRADEEECDEGKTTHKEKEKKNKKHYSPKLCPVCGTSVVHLGRHIVNVHVKKNQCMPVVRLTPLLEMGKHVNSVRGAPRKEKAADGSRVEYKGRRRVICPVCDKVMLYISTHLRRTHHFKKRSSQYKTAMKMARYYEGASKEINVDVRIHEKRKRKAKQVSGTKPYRSRIRKEEMTDESDESDLEKEKRPKKRRKLATTDESDESDLEPSDKKKVNYGLDVLMAELSERGSEGQDESNGDEDYKPESDFDSSEMEIMPPTPQPSASFTSLKGVQSATRNTELSAHECEPNQVNLTDEADKEHDEERPTGNGENASEDDNKVSDEEGNEEDDEEYDSWKSYYRRGKGRTVFARLLILYCSHLQSIHGGGQKERHAIHHAQNVRKIKECLDSHSGTATNDNIDCLIRDGGLDICKVWAQPKLDAKDLRPGTIKSYFTSLSKFLEFIIDQHESTDMPSISPDTLAKIPKVVRRLKVWGSSISKQYGHERWEQILEDRRNAITTEDIQGIDGFEPTLFAEHSLERAKDQRVSQPEFFAIRDYLIVRLGLENAQRPGPMESARLRDFTTAEDDGEGWMVMYVARHKTSTGGPAPLVMKPSLHKKVKEYVENVRPLFADEKETALFVTQEGRSFEPGTIGKRIIAWWRKATGKKITSTDLRKLTASTLHDADPIEKRHIHDHMCHREDTAEKFYMTRKKSTQASASHRAITRRLGIDKPEVEEEVDESVETEPAANETHHLDSEHNLQKRNEEDEEEESDAESHHISGRGLSKEQLADIDLLFSESICTNAKISMQTVKDTMKECLSLFELVEDDAFVKKVYDRVRYRKQQEGSKSMQKIEQVNRTKITCRKRRVKKITVQRLGKVV